MRAKSHHIPMPALTLGIAGLLPFFACAFITWVPSAGTVFSFLMGPQSESGTAYSDMIKQKAVLGLGAYGAVILSFLGGVRWGNLLHNKTKINQWIPLTMSVVPSLIAWPALLLPTSWMLSILAAGFVLQYATDVEGVRQKILPIWFGRLRTTLTTGAVLSLLAGLLAAAIG